MLDNHLFRQAVVCASYRNRPGGGSAGSCSHAVPGRAGERANGQHGEEYEKIYKDQISGGKEERRGEGSWLGSAWNNKKKREKRESR